MKESTIFNEHDLTEKVHYVYRVTIDEKFIRKNFLITDDKNNLRFLRSVYSKLSGYSESHICKEKRIGKLSFLYGIKSIALTEEQESVKTEEIKVIIKSRNYEKE